MDLTLLLVQCLGSNDFARQIHPILLHLYKGNMPDKNFHRLLCWNPGSSAQYFLAEAVQSCQESH